jgi:CheY-like chemotaxis protein
MLGQLCGQCANQDNPVTAANGSSLSYKVENGVQSEVHLHHQCADKWAKCFNIPLSKPSVAALENKGTKRIVRILIADDVPTILRLVKRILNDHPGFEVVGEARDGRTATALAQVLKPDVVVLNVTMPTMSGFEAARLIRSSVPDTAIVILSSHKDKQFVAEARKAGAKGYVEKSDADGQLVRAIQSAVKGAEFFVVE